MRSTRNAAAAALAALALLAGCGGGDSETSASTAAGSGNTTTTAAVTTTVAATTTTRAAEALRAALLTPADVPGSVVSTSPPSDADFGACFPGNPIGAKAFPGEVEGPDLELTEGNVQRQYSSAARQGTADQARDFVTTFSSEQAVQCVVNAFKSFITSDPDPPKLDPSNLTGKAADAPVADDAGVLTVSGSLVAGTQSIPIGVELLVFRKGSTVVLVSAGAVQGPVVAGQAVELAQKVAGRLS